MVRTAYKSLLWEWLRHHNFDWTSFIRFIGFPSNLEFIEASLKSLQCRCNLDFTQYNPETFFLRKLWALNDYPEAAMKKGELEKICAFVTNSEVSSALYALQYLSTQEIPKDCHEISLAYGTKSLSM